MTSDRATRFGKLRSSRALAALALVMMSLFTSLVVAEVSSGGNCRLIFVGSWADPDPIPRLVWEVDREDPSVQPLNPLGEQNGDGPPEFAIRPADGQLVFVWSAVLGGSQGVAFAEWTDQHWSAPVTLSNGPEDLDPRVFIDPTGAVSVVWWSATSPSQAWLISRPSGSVLWSPPIAVTAPGESARRPSVVSFDGSVYIAYERPSQQSGTFAEVVVARSSGGGPFVVDSVFPTVQNVAARVEPILHVAQGRLWVDWKHAAGQMAFSLRENPAGWTSVSTRPWTDPSWIGAELTRQLIRWTVLVN